MAKSTPAKKAASKSSAKASTKATKAASSVATAGKVVKPQTNKPKGKIVKSLDVEDANEIALTNIKKGKAAVASTPAESSLVETKKINKALNELKKFIKNNSKSPEKSQLFEDELINDVQIVLNRKDLFTAKKNFKPKLIKLQEGDIKIKRTIALLVRDDLITKELLEKIEETELNDLIGEIIPAQELKTTYKQFEKRRELFGKYDLFISDDGLVTSLPKLLGKTFYESKKLPIPIKVNKEDFSIPSTINQIKKILNSVIYTIPRSNTLTINLGSIENLTESIIIQIINHFANDSLTGIFIKTNQSPALPLYEAEVVYEAKDLINDDVDSKDKDDEISLTTFEKGLVELAAPDSELVNILKTKKEKITKKLSKKKNNKKAVPSKASPESDSKSSTEVTKTSVPAAGSLKRSISKVTKPSNIDRKKKKTIKA